MPISEMLLPEFDQEMAGTRKTLERVPEAKFDWKPHEKSMSMKDLATHMANLPSWTVETLDHDSFDMNPKDGEPPRMEPIESVRDALEIFDKNVTKAREAIARTTDEQFVSSWSLLSGGETVFTMPKVAVLRGMILNHNVHHRAQMGLYLRLNDVAVPSIYGPSADEAS
jgi:uncharacterized damage-inducible protein DinB